MAILLRDLNGGQHAVLEANFLAARRTGQVKAQLPLGDDFQENEPVENGMFLVYDMEAEEIKKPANHDTLRMMLHFSVEKEYNHLRPGLDTFAIYKGATPYPRLFQPHVGDTFITDAVRISGSTGLNAAAKQAAWDGINVGLVCGVGDDGYINATANGASANGVRAKLIEKTTLPNGGQAGKFEIIHVA